MTAVQELKLSPEPPRRFLVGLKWTPKEKSFTGSLFSAIYELFITDKKARAEDRKGRLEAASPLSRDTNDNLYDINLRCYVFDRAGKLITEVGTEQGEGLDASGKINHTGEDADGMAGEGEQIFVQTLGLPENYAHLFFVAVSDCKYTFSQIPDATLRLADGKTNANFLEVRLIENAYGRAFVHVFRDGDGWKFESLDDSAGDIDWAERLKARLSQ